MARVSVCIPTYNGASFLAEAIGSVLAQTYDDFELIICDDASSDETLQVAASFRDERMRVVSNPTRLGLVGNWNRCLELARGEYITIFHQDDVMAPDSLALKVVMLDANPQAGFVFTDINRIDGDGTRIGGHYVEQPSVTGVLTGDEVYQLTARVGNPIACPTVIVRASCYQELGGYDDRMAFAVDLEMWLRIAAHYDVGYIALPLLSHRVHAHQEGGRFRDTGCDFKDMLMALDTVYSRNLPPAYARHAPVAYQTISEQAYALGRWQLLRARPIPAARYLIVAFKARRRTSSNSHSFEAAATPRP